MEKNVVTVKKYNIIESYSPIQAILICDNFKAKSLENQLISNGIFVKAILSPTVAVGTERLRISLHSFNTKEQIDRLIDTLNQLMT